MNDSPDRGNRPVSPSVSPLVRQAARNLHRLELMAGNTACSSNWFYCWHFWRTRRMMAVTPDEVAAWLPALALAVSCEKDDDVLAEFAQWPIPEPLPPEALPWRDRLIQVWEQYPADTTWEKTIRLAALVRLDRRAERLPEWLAEARRAMDWRWDDPDIHYSSRYHSRYLPLVTLAGWRPLPGARPPHMDRWIRFWEQLYRTPTIEGIIAAAALLNLAEGGWLSPGLSLERLREEFCRRVRQRFTDKSRDLQDIHEYDEYRKDMNLLRILLSSVPADASSPERQDIMEWLELTHRNVPAEKREAVWNMLVAWQREGILERYGISLSTYLSGALEWEQDRDVLRAMAGYVPGLAEVRAHPEAIRAIIAFWEAPDRYWWDTRCASWVARWNLLRAGAMTAEEQTRFGADYVDAIKSEKDWNVLLTLVQIQPPGTFPLATWAGRLSDQGDWHRLAAHLAIHDWLVKVMEGTSGEWRVASGSEASGEWRVEVHDSLLAARQYGQFPELPVRLAITRRHVRQVLRRAGQENTDTGTVVPFVNLPPEVLPDFRRLHEIETALAAGQMPPPDAGAGNRPIPRTVPARLPETQPRMNPPGGTGLASTAKSTTRPPSSETVRHE